MPAKDNIKENLKNALSMQSLKEINKNSKVEKKCKSKQSLCNFFKNFIKGKIAKTEGEGHSIFSMDDLNYIIYPDSFFKKIWNLFLTVLLIYTAIVLPYTICYLDETTSVLKTFELIVDISFMMDIVVNFFSAYFNETGIIIDDFSQITSNYLKGWFGFDLVGCFPVQSIIDATNFNASTNLNNIRIYKLFRLIRMIKMVRILKYGRIMNYIFMRLKINLSIGKIISIFFAIFLIVHIVSCLWYFTIKVNDSEITWIISAGVQDKDKFLIYLTSVYWAFVTLFTVGYGDVHPTNNVERCLCIIWMVFGAGFYSYTIGNLITIIQNFDKKESLISSKVDQIEEFASKIQLNSDLASKLKSFFEHKFSENFIYDNENIMDELSDELAFKVIKTVFSSALQMFEIFHENPPIKFVNSFILKMKALFMDDHNYYIYKIAEIAEEVCFMITGKVALLDEDMNEVVTHGSGAYFGEVEIFFDEPRLFSVRTMKTCEILFISRDDYTDILKAYPKIFEVEIYKAYKRRLYYMRKVGKYRRAKLKKMGINDKPNK